jgi:transcriptional regulator with XRE-family HTH domain
MIASGAQIRAARGFLGWTQQDLANAAGLHVNAIRYWEWEHGRRQDYPSATGYGAERITEALRQAGLMLQFDPPGVEINTYVYDPVKRPPIYTRWDKWRKRNRPFRG